MPGSISLPQIVLDLEEADRKAYENLQPPKSMVVRYGGMKFVAELPYDGKEKVGCGSKLVIRTDRGTELATMLTTTCPNSGCGKSVSRQDMLAYIEASGGKNFPFSTSGRILRIATVEDTVEQQQLDARKPEMLRFAKSKATELNLTMKLADVELLLGGERIIFHYTSEQWIDFRELVKVLAAEYQTRIEMHQVNARDEARLVADFERCGQHCCCRQFLKVLKPVNMRMAKVQKATLDPAKISGRCGRLMCCLRYEDETYEELRKRLPRKQTRWMSPDGPGTVIDTQILTQLVLLKLDQQEAPQAFPLEELRPLAPDEDPIVIAKREGRPIPGTPGSPGAHGNHGGPAGGPRRPMPARPSMQPRRQEPPRPKPQPMEDPLDDLSDASENLTPSPQTPATSEPPTDIDRDIPDNSEPSTPTPPVSRGYTRHTPGSTPGVAHGNIPPEGVAPGAPDSPSSENASSGSNIPNANQGMGGQAGEGGRRRRRRRRRGRGRGGPGGSGGPGGPDGPGGNPPSDPSGGGAPGDGNVNS